jgi:anti-anti-sigma factor
MKALARVEEEHHGEVPVARVHGEVDASNATEIGVRLRSVLSNRSVVMIVDLSPTEYIDSAGLNLLFALADEMRSRQQRLVLVVADGSPISRMVTLVGLDQTATTYSTLDEALSDGREDVA